MVSGELEVDLDFRQAKLRGQALNLSQHYVKVLIYLMQHPHEDIHLSKILDQVWPQSEEPSENQVRMAIYYIREALQDYDEFLKTVRGEGRYRWVKDVTSEE